jgi:hypothetical protein
MKNIVTFTAIAALTAMPFVAEAKGKGQGQGHGGGNAQSAQNHGDGHGNNGNGRGNGNGKKHDRAEPARGNDNARGGNADLARIATGIAAASGLIYLTPDMDAEQFTDDDYRTIANCPPGLAKKDPPCVPPGLAKKGVTYQDWAGYDQDALRGVFDDRWTAYTPAVPAPDAPRDTALTSAQIRQIFDLPAEPEGKRYAVIDGRPVLLSAEDYEKLMTINTLAARPTLADSITVLPDAALTQEQLINRYNLPALGDGQNYAVLDNQIIALPDQSYDLLQLIRILGAV